MDDSKLINSNYNVEEFMNEIEVHQNLTLTGEASKLTEIKRELEEFSSSSWKFDKNLSKRTRERSDKESILCFICEETSNFPAAQVVLWPNADGYYLANIVQLKYIKKLEIKKYNSILNSFKTIVLEKIASKFEYTIDISSRFQSPKEWFSQKTLIALEKYLASANRSEGTVHSSDQKRWNDFIIAYYNDNENYIQPSLLDFFRRWLSECQYFDINTAEELISGFDTGLQLIKRREETRYT